MKLRALAVAAIAAVPSISLISPAQAWECQKMELCHQATMTVCMVVTDALGDPACH